MIVVWDWMKGLQMASVNGHGSIITDVQFSPYVNEVLVDHFFTRFLER
jgi:hypothetical protein